jgi:hypothetical protein
MYADRFAPYSATNIHYAKRAQVPGFRADVVRDGVVVAKISIPDNDAAVEHEFTSVAHRFRFEQHLASLAPAFFPEKLADEDTMRACFLLDLVDAEHADTQLQQMCQSHTVFRLKGDVEDHWRELDEPYSPALAKAIRSEYQSGLDMIANEIYGTSATGVGHA